MQNLVTRLGIIPSIILTTFVSIALAFVISAAMAGLFGSSLRLNDLATAIVVPLVLVPLLAYFVFTTQKQLASTAETLHILANTDPLTTAFNRKYFVELAEKELAASRRYGENFSILLFDVDNFQQINETYGYPIGDYVLRMLCEICRGQIRKNDILARLENDAFACLLSHTSNVGAMEFAERLQATVNTTSMSVNNRQVQFTISIGIKTIDADSNLDAILRQATLALDAAKKQGKNRTISAAALPNPTAQN